MVEQNNILLQQKILLFEHQNVLIKEIRQVNAKIDLSPFSVKFDDVLTSVSPPSISSDSVDYSEWIKIKWAKPYYDNGSQTITRSFYINPTVLKLFKLSCRGRKSQTIAINQAMLDYCMKFPELSKMIQRFLSSPNELHSIVEFDSDGD